MIGGRGGRVGQVTGSLPRQGEKKMFSDLTVLTEFTLSLWQLQTICS